MARLAEELGDVTSSTTGDGTTCERAGSAFARLAGGVIELRLPDDIGEAALRTPDTSEVPGQAGWVRFSPRSSERHVHDRAEAWFRTAWRHAGAR